MQANVINFVQLSFTDSNLVPQDFTVPTLADAAPFFTAQTLGWITGLQVYIIAFNENGTEKTINIYGP